MPAFFFDLDDHPQLAALEILACALQVAELSLLAEHQDLAAGEVPCDGDDVETWIADSIIIQINLLLQHLQRYRAAIDERQLQQTSSSDEVPL